jgi:hypothetical protein
MKNLKFYTLAALFFAAVTFVKAQDNDLGSGNEMKTLLGNSGDLGGYGALTVRYTEIDSRDGIMIGGRGGIVIGHNISFGLTGTGFFTNSQYDPAIGEDAMIAGGYGGIYIEPILFPNQPVHLAFPITFGVGGIGYARHNYDNDHNWDNNDWNDSNGEGFLLVEPGVEVELNVMRYFRFAVGASYKVTSDIDLKYDDGLGNRIIPTNSLNGLTVGVTFKFGWF